MVSSAAQNGNRPIRTSVSGGKQSHERGQLGTCFLRGKCPRHPKPCQPDGEHQLSVCYATSGAPSWDRAPPSTGHAREAQRRSTERTPSRLPRPRMPNVENSAKGGHPPCLLILQRVLAVQWLQLFLRLRKDSSKETRNPHRPVLRPQWRVPHVSRFSKRGIPHRPDLRIFVNGQRPGSAFLTPNT